MKKRISLFLLFNILFIFIGGSAFAEGNYEIIKLREGISPYGSRAFNDGLIPVMYDGSISENGNWAYLTEEGNVFSHKSASGFDYSEGLTPIIKESVKGNDIYIKLGYMDRQGKIVIPPKFDVYSNSGVTFAGRFKNGEALVFKYDEETEVGYWYRINRLGERIDLKEKIDTETLISKDKVDNRIYNDSYTVNYESEETIELFGEKIDRVKFHKDKALVAVKKGKSKGSYIISKKNISEEDLIAKRSNQNIVMNDEKIDFNAYLIKGNNYFKLRDIAYILNGSNKQFDVKWTPETQEIDLYPNKEYTVVGGEMSMSGDPVVVPKNTNSAIFLDEDRVTVKAYKLKGNNYFKLRDIGRLMDIGIDWNEKNNTITINTNKGYSEE